MSFADKNTVALDEEELEIFNTIRKVAPKHRIAPKLAQTYGVWTICFRRYCEAQSIPWLWMSSVSDFMDFLDDQSNISATERNRALDGIMFYITDVHKRRQEEAEEKQRSSSVPQSTKSLFAEMLLRCDVSLTGALRIRREDVQLDNATITVPGNDEQGTRVVPISSTLHEGLQNHVQRVEDRTTSTNPLLFGPRQTEDRTDESSSTDEDFDRSTELATRVMKTFNAEKQGGGTE